MTWLSYVVCRWFKKVIIRSIPHRNNITDLLHCGIERGQERCIVGYILPCFQSHNTSNQFISLLAINLIKEVFSDFNNMVLWHESEDIYFMTWIRKHFSWFQSYVFNLCTIMCVSLPHRLPCWIKFYQWDFLWKLLSFHTEMISA